MSYRNGAQPRLVFLHCPVCDSRINLPFVSTSGPVPYVHRSRTGQLCRLVVTPDPVGHDHQVVEVGAKVFVETVLEEVLQRWRAASTTPS